MPKVPRNAGKTWALCDEVINLPTYVYDNIKLKTQGKILKTNTLHFETNTTDRILINHHTQQNKCSDVCSHSAKLMKEEHYKKSAVANPAFCTDMHC
jgi:hypothetical protein